MNIRTRSHSLSRLAAAGAFALGLAWAGASYADTITEDNVAQHIAAAKTPQDHQDIANFYTAQAAAAAAKVKLHQQMDSAYKSGQSGKTEAKFHEHCKDLIASYTREQKDNEALAKEHEAMAKAAK